MIVAAALAPAQVLAKYSAALANLNVPPMMSYVFSVEQAGARDLREVHRVYRRGLDVRDETLARDGQTLKLPEVSILHLRRDRYAIANVSPSLDRYTFLFEESDRAGGGIDYLFRTIPDAGTSAPGFVVDSLTIDGTTFLPVAIHFHSSSPAAHGSGVLTFARVDRYWLVRGASVRALAGTVDTRERVVWSAYQFPASLPEGTFGAVTPSAPRLAEPGALP